MTRSRWPARSRPSRPGEPSSSAVPRPVVRVAESERSLALERPGASPVRLHPGDELEVSGPVVANSDGTLTWGTTQGLVTAPPDALRTVAPPADAAVRCEEAVVEGPTPSADEVDTLRLTAPLRGCYDRDAVRVLANVAPATHGESRAQVLGSGDAARAYQQFALAQAPLTYVATTTGGGVASTLEVLVDGRRWREVPQLYGAGPRDEVFTTTADDEGGVTVRFGDGRTGARLPTGVNNVTAQLPRRHRTGRPAGGRRAHDADDPAARAAVGDQSAPDRPGGRPRAADRGPGQRPAHGADARPRRVAARRGGLRPRHPRHREGAGRVAVGRPSPVRPPDGRRAPADRP